MMVLGANFGIFFSEVPWTNFFTLFIFFSTWQVLSETSVNVVMWPFPESKFDLKVWKLPKNVNV
jgi:hypothetical protein